MLQIRPNDDIAPMKKDVRVTVRRESPLVRQRYVTESVVQVRCVKAARDFCPQHRIADGRASFRGLRESMVSTT